MTLYKTINRETLGVDQLEIYDFEIYCDRIYLLDAFSGIMAITSDGVISNRWRLFETFTIFNVF